MLKATINEMAIRMASLKVKVQSARGSILLCQASPSGRPLCPPRTQHSVTSMLL
jgi:hypothetical protein